MKHIHEHALSLTLAGCGMGVLLLSVVDVLATCSFFCSSWLTCGCASPGKLSNEGLRTLVIKQGFMFEETFLNLYEPWGSESSTYIQLVL